MCSRALFLAALLVVFMFISSNYMNTSYVITVDIFFHGNLDFEKCTHVMFMFFKIFSPDLIDAISQ